MNLKSSLPGILIFLAAFGLALLGLNPSFYMDDSSEIITSAATLGLAHPPGYPLYTLLGHLASLLPLGPPSLRVNLLSALSGALACWLLFTTLKDRFKLSPALAWPFALLWMAGATAFPAALSAKNGVYQLTAAFLLAILSSLWRGKSRLAFLLFGISLCNHWMSMVVYGAGFAYLAWAHLRDRPAGPKEIIRYAVFLLLGLTPYLYLPLRSALNPLLNWGHPVDLGNFLMDVSRHSYKNRDFSGDPLLWFQEGLDYFRSAFLEFSGLGILSLLGLYAAWRQYRRQALGLAFSWVGLFLAVCVFSKYSSRHSYLMENYSISSFILLPLLAALGFGFLQNYLERFGKAVLVASLFVAWIGVGGLVLKNFTQGSQAYYTYTYDYVLNAWRSVPRNGLFFCKGDVLDFPCWYFQILEGKRPDMPVLGGGSLPMDWYRIYLTHTHPGLEVPFPVHEKGKEYISGHLMKWMVDHNPGHWYFFTYPDLSVDGLEDMKLVPNGLTQEGFLPPTKPLFDEARAEGLWRDMRLRHFTKPDDSVDEVSWDDFLKDYAMARLWMALRYAQEAEEALGTGGKKLSPGQLREGREYYRKSLPHLLWVQNWDPANPQYSVNLGLVYSYMGDPRSALDWFKEAAALDPTKPEPFYEAGMSAYQVGDKAQARTLFQKALEASPDFSQARQALQNMGNP